MHVVGFLFEVPGACSLFKYVWIDPWWMSARVLRFDEFPINTEQYYLVFFLYLLCILFMMMFNVTLTFLPSLLLLFFCARESSFSKRQYRWQCIVCSYYVRFRIKSYHTSLQIMNHFVLRRIIQFNGNLTTRNTYLRNK